MLTKRLKIAVGVGAILGIFCIIGVGYRQGYAGNGLYLFAMWYNRIIMGLLIGFAGNWMKDRYIIRGLILGTLVTTAFFLSTAFRDWPGFLAGIAYGVIIDYFATKYS
ncbi:MAG TPA: hypothetical protein VKN64_04840 [Halanaerobiales bacterium]|nr:hypothetical protein [Halanaerobiales bacterium]